MEWQLEFMVVKYGDEAWRRWFEWGILVQVSAANLFAKCIHILLNSPNEVYLFRVDLCELKSLFSNTIFDTKATFAHGNRTCGCSLMESFTYIIRVRFSSLGLLYVIHKYVYTKYGP